MFALLAASTALAFASTAQAGADFPPIPADKSTPVAQRLSLSGPTAMYVAWNTYQRLEKPCVHYGTTPGRLDQTACSSSSVTYPTSRTWANSVQLTGLSAGSTYFYKIDSTNSTTDEFKTALAAGDQTPFSIATVIDLGVYGRDGFMIDNGNETQKRDIPKIDPALNHTTIGSLYNKRDSFDWVIHPGDAGYADDWFEVKENVLDGSNAYEAILENFWDQLSIISRSKPYMLSPGNHEADCTEIPLQNLLCPEGQKNFTDFRNRFTMPFADASTSSNQTATALRQQAKQLAQPPFWFSFDSGMVHVTMIDTETDFPNAPDAPGGSASLNSGPFGRAMQQLDFLKADLASVDRRITPWVLVAGHRPWYSVDSTSGGEGCKPCQAAFEDILYQYGVDLAIFGHVHNSQRYDPVYNGTVDPAGLKDPKAPMYIVAGGAGNIEGLTKVKSQTNAGVPFVYDADYSYGRITFQDKNNLQVQFIRSQDDSVLDTSVLFKSHNDAFVSQ